MFWSLVRSVFDYIMDFQGLFAERIMPERVHKLSLSFLVDTLVKQRGGTAGNIAYSFICSATLLLSSRAREMISPVSKALKQLHNN